MTGLIYLFCLLSFFLGSLLFSLFVLIPRAVANYIAINQQPKALAHAIENAIWSLLLLAISFFFLVKFTLLAVSWFAY